MCKYLLLICSIFITGLANLLCGQTKPVVNIIPKPSHMSATGKYSSIQSIKYKSDDLVFSSYAEVLLDSMKRYLKVMNTTVKSEQNLKVILFPTMATESYVLNISKNDIQISASDHVGLQYAMTSLEQIVRFNKGKLPIITIRDSPKFRYRGLHLDVSRHFFSVDDVKRYLDYMAYYKFNNFHWHLTDDQGWRLDILKYPNLKEIAAVRKETLTGHYNDEPQQFDGKSYTGYYTHAEVKEIVAYASERNINVIPEIEMPGHALAALAAYPELGCEDKQYEVATKWGVFEDVFCPTEQTFAFLEDVIDEVITLFPGKYIHIGGDECPKDAWKRSAFCQDLIKKNKLKDEHELQSYFITRMEKYINSRGKQIIGWDEILEGGLAPNATVMSWRGIEGGLAAAKENHDVIMTPGTHCYFDHYQSESPDEPLAIGGYTPLEKVYTWNPVPQDLEEDKHKYILGGQANLWSEYIKTYAGVEYMVYARGMAMSEALWTQANDYPGFLRRYSKHHSFWKSKGANIANHTYDLKPKIKAGKAKPVTISFSLPQNVEIEHTVNGGKKTIVQSGKEIVITQSGHHTFQARSGAEKGKPLDLHFDLHLATKAMLTLAEEPAQQYYGNGPGSIVNGVMGSNEKYGGTEWLGFNGHDCTGVLDFGKEIMTKEIHFRFFKGEGQWIYLPQKIEVFTSADGKTFTPLQSLKEIKSDTKIAKVNMNLGNTKTRYLKFNITNFGKIPDGAQGAGHKAWLFVDEVVVR